MSASIDFLKAILSYLFKLKISANTVLIYALTMGRKYGPNILVLSLRAARSGSRMQPAEWPVRRPCCASEAALDDPVLAADPGRASKISSPEQIVDLFHAGAVHRRPH
ncbi:MAG: hypothetical protein AAF501_07485, partial [Pseudomonadota bacterium]